MARRNPTLKWHRKQEDVALKQHKGAMTKLGGKFYEGKVAAQQDSIRKEWQMKRRKHNPIEYGRFGKPIAKRLLKALEKEAAFIRKKDNAVGVAESEKIVVKIVNAVIDYEFRGT